MHTPRTHPMSRTWCNHRGARGVKLRSQPRCLRTVAVLPSAALRVRHGKETDSPVTLEDGEVVVGFDQNKLSALLGLE